MKLNAGKVKSAKTGKTATVVVKPKFYKGAKWRLPALGGIMAACLYALANEFFYAGARGHYEAEFNAWDEVGNIEKGNVDSYDKDAGFTEVPEDLED